MFDTTLLILLGLAALGFISHNTTVAISILVLIIVRVTPLNAFFPWVEKQGLTVGIIILTIGVMAPIASGTLCTSIMLIFCQLKKKGDCRLSQTSSAKKRIRGNFSISVVMPGRGRRWIPALIPVVPVHR